MSSLDLTPKEMALLKALGKFIQPSSVDWSSIATEAGFNTAKQARDKWYPLRDKLFGKESGASPAGKRAVGRKRKAGSEEGGANKKGKKVDSVVEGDGDDEEGHGAGVKEEPAEDVEDYDLV